MEFPTYDEAWACGGLLHENLELYSRMPWVLPGPLCNRTLTDDYTSGGLLPCGTPISALDSFDWGCRVAIPDASLNMRRFGSISAARQAHVGNIAVRLGRHSTPLKEIPYSYGVDAFVYRTEAEVGYVRGLLSLSVDRWRGPARVHNDALCWDKPILKTEFRYNTKYAQTFWDWTAWERRIRARSGLFIPYQCIEAETIMPEQRYRHYVRVPLEFSSFEMSRGCHAEIPPVITYKGSIMNNDAASGYWTVFYTEWTSIVAAWVLWDVYDSYKLWYVPRILRSDMRKLRLDRVLGSRANEEELHGLLDIIDRVEWTSAEYVHTTKGASSREDLDAEAPGDFVWYDPWARARVGREVAQQRRANKPTMPFGHLRGYHYETGTEPEEDVNMAETAGSTPLPTETRRDSIPRDHHNIGGSSAAAGSGPVNSNPHILEENHAVRVWLFECGVPSTEIPRGRLALKRWGEERLTRPRTQICSDCKYQLCDACWTAYEGANPAGPAPQHNSQVAQDTAPADEDDITPTEPTATF